jgi:hypothetical protein
MNGKPAYCRIGWLIVVVGLCFSAASSFMPVFDGTYKLHVTLLLAGALPYLIYAILVQLMPSMTTLVAGAVLVAAHIGLRLAEGGVMYPPLVLAALLLPVLVAAVRRPWPDSDDAA